MHNNLLEAFYLGSPTHLTIFVIIVAIRKEHVVLNNSIEKVGRGASKKLTKALIRKGTKGSDLFLHAESYSTNPSRSTKRVGYASNGNRVLARCIISLITTVRGYSTVCIINFEFISPPSNCSRGPRRLCNRSTYHAQHKTTSGKRQGWH